MVYRIVVGRSVQRFGVAQRSGNDTECGPNDVADSMERLVDDPMWTACDTRPSLVDVWCVGMMPATIIMVHVPM